MAAETVPSFSEGQVVLATWHHLLDRGSLQDGEPFLAGTAPRPVARVSPSTAAAFGLAEGDTAEVSTQVGSVRLPVVVTEGMVDHVVWLPTNTTGSDLRDALAGAPGAPGALVSVTKEGHA